ncbi:MAG: undecaprenyl/decaprenyl-phosphate alpha-N-acetylglucosaminyl 1-phosphate transferase [Synergistaceae bacterium]|nr:undecaprenyl/decaprenyl-phosphate alpha-N-acetylglucosaminyl 1-phosphate transferase [Synergistaceae bacterium]
MPDIDVKALIFILIGFFWGGFTAPVSIRLAGIYGIIDVPDARKIHKGKMPRGAGLGLWLGYVLMAVIMSGDATYLRYVMTGATIIFFCGYLDDMCSLSPFLRLGLHFIASALVVLPLNLNILLALIAIVWLAGVTSAYNLIDGMNGLCISMFIASSVILFLLGNSYEAIYMGAMALGVLCWNFPAAQTFLGDGGSTLLGYLFASNFLIIAMQNLQSHGVRFHELIILLILFGGVPVIDTITAFSRRILSGKSPFYPDKKHLHHILISLTGSNVFTVSVLLLLQVLILIGGLSVYLRITQ